MRDTGLTRRTFLTGTALGSLALLLPRGLRAEAFALPEATKSALASSPLVYVSPLRKDGKESTCHGEVWFVAEGGDVLVVTAADRWKAKALTAGLEGARLWVGDFGNWKSAGDRFKSAPGFAARARFEKDPAARERALAAFGRKYPAEWDKWGPRFRDGLADGSRVLIRYVSAGA
jgi:hypothetical protein